METIGKGLALFESFLAHAHAVSIIVGLLLSLGFTQWAKYPLRAFTDARGLPLQAFKFLTRTFSAATGLAVTWVTWPDPGLFGFLWGCVTGFFAPLVYTGFVRAVGRFWPWLADKASSDKIDS